MYAVINAYKFLRYIRWQKEWQKLPAKEIISTLKNQVIIGTAVSLHALLDRILLVIYWFHELHGRIHAHFLSTRLWSQDLKSVNLLASHTKDTLNLACQLAIDGQDSIALTAFLLASGKALLSEGNRYDNFIGMIVDKLLNSSNKENTSNTNIPSMYKDEERSLILKNLEITVLLKKDIEGSSAHQTPELTSWKNVPPILRAAQVC